MKGFTHFAGGLAVTSFFPAAVNAGAAGVPWYFVLGGAAALLPDTVDFKFLRFLYRHDREIAPDAVTPDPAPVAVAVAATADSAAVLGKPVSIKLNTVPLGGNAWRQYRVRFDPSRSEVIVTIGPVVSTSQTVVGTAPCAAVTAAVATNAVVFPAYLAEITVDILDGPVLEMRPQPDGRIRVEFIPWHRSRSHSLVLATLFGLLVAAAWGLTAGAIGLAAYASHVLADQLGFMGSSLWYPLSRRRIPGLQRLHAMSPFANATFVWTSLLLIFWNLSRAAGPDLAYALPRLLFFGVALPVLGIRWLSGLGSD